MFLTIFTVRTHRTTHKRELMHLVPKDSTGVGGEERKEWEQIQKEEEERKHKYKESQ